MTEEILQIDDLQLKFYTYEGVVEALDGVKINLKKGETLGIVGETGCGKSVTGLSVLSIVLPPGKIEGGQIIFNVKGRAINLLNLGDSVLRKIRGKYISMIFQDPRSALNPVYTAGDQIIEALLKHKIKELAEKAIEELDKEAKNKKANFLTRYCRNNLQKIVLNPKASSLKIVSKIPLLNRYKKLLYKQAKKEAIRMLRLMRIPDPERVVDMYPHELSGGMAQRVVIAMALACNPEVLIADEPTTNLDVTVQLQILNLIKELKQQFSSAIIYITHDMGVVAELCDRVAVMYAGNVVEIADTLEIFKNPLHPYTKGLLESIPRPGCQFKSIEGTVPSLIDPPKGCRFHNRCQYAMEICTRVKPKMIDVGKNHFIQCFLYQ
ncbi:MAG: ABC transporter ATP-binding protein [Candidatus Freyarchaeota archaeon]|nr:ABC transporter ATP-binding protein [Candidatus Jordarchaeia archaeon]